MRFILGALLTLGPCHCVFAQAAGRQTVMEFLSSEIESDAAFETGERAALLEALRRRFADYGLQPVSPPRLPAARAALHVISEGSFDAVPPLRIAEAAFAAYQAIGRGAPADVVEGIALYGYRKRVSAERIATWANGYRQLVDNKVPGEIAADLIRNALEKDWDDSTFNILKWALAQAAKDGFDPRDYAVYLLGHMTAGERAGALSARARSYFRGLSKSKSPPVLPPYRGVFSRQPFPQALYEAKAEAASLGKAGPKSSSAPAPEKPRSKQPTDLPPKAGTLQALAMQTLWPGLKNSAYSYLGTPYVWGGISRDGIDCSALTQNSYGENKVRIPRVSRQQWETGRPVAPESLGRGDLVFFNTRGSGVSHVGMVVDPKGPRFIHASSSHGVVIADLSKKYYRARYLGARRIVL